MATCPNINLPEWKALEAAKPDLAYYLWDKYDGNVPANELLDNSPEIINKVKQVIKKMGVQIQPLSTYAKNNPDIDESSINAVTDLATGVIAISEGKYGVDTLTEEMVHVATEIINQVDPKTVTEMISKIGRFKIYKETLDQYKDFPAYQLEDGKPNIRKIKKEAVDKLITQLIVNNISNEDLSLEENRSMVRRMWDSITDWFRGEYKKANIDIFSKTAKTVLGGEFEGSYVDLDSTEMYYQASDAQKEFMRQVNITEKTLRKTETKEEEGSPVLIGDKKATSFYELLIDGEYVIIKKRVTDRVKAWYKSKFGDKVFTPSEKKDNEVKRKLGTRYHEFFEEIHDRFFNSDGTRRVTPGERPYIKDVLDNNVYTKLEKYYTDLIAEFSKDGKNPLVLSELKVYDAKEKEAGTIDLLIVEEDGTANIYDWKFMNVSPTAEDVAWFKQGAYGIQLDRYRKILLDNYNIKEIGKNRAVPIIMDLQRDNFQDPNSPLKIKGIKIGSVDPNNMDPLTLTPVSAPSETTGDKKLDLFIKQLNAVVEQISNKKTKGDDELAFKVERSNIIRKAIRSLQGQQNIQPLLDTINVMIREGENLMSEWKTSYEGRPPSADDLKDIQLSEYSADIRDYIASAAVFEKITNYIGDMIYKKGDSELGTKEQLEFLESLQKQQIEISSLKTNLELVAGEFAEKFIGERNLVTGLMNPEKVVKGLGSWFRGLSTIGLKSTDLLYTMANQATNKAERDTIPLVNRLIAIQKRITDRGGDTSKEVLKLYQKDTEGGLVNKLIYKYDKEFYDSVKRNSEEGARSKKWLADNINVQDYIKESKLKLAERISRIKKSYPDGQLKEKLILEEQKKWDITRKDFNGFGNYIIKRHPQEKWLSKEYSALKKDADLFELYNFISDINKQAQEVGYIQNKVTSTFLPFIRKSMAESLAWDGPNLKAVGNLGKNLTTRADDVGYGKINSLTGEVEQAIPKYYTSDFSVTEDGPNDYSDVSLDLFKNMILYTQHMNKYKYLTEIEDQLLLVRTVETFKDHLRSNKNNEVIPGEILKGNTENVKILDQFLDTVIYGQKYAVDDSDMAYGAPVIKGVKTVVNKVFKSFGAKTDVFKNDEVDALSLTKTMETLNRYIQMKSLGFNPVSGAVNAFGGNLQISALAGRYFDAREVYKYEAQLVGNKFKNDDEREMFVQLLDKFMPLKDDPTYDKLRDAGMKKLTRTNFSDMLFIMFREPEQLLEKAVFKAMLDNVMVENGRIVNIRDFVRDKYKSEYSSGTAAERSAAYKSSKEKIKQEIAELKKSRSINVTKKLVDGKLEIPGLDLNNSKELMRVTDVARNISRSATGGLTEFDEYRANMNIWTKSLMVFKGWIPKLVLTRYGGFRKAADNFNVEIDENGQTTGEKYEVGRLKLFMSVVGLDIMRSIKNITSIYTMDENGVKVIDELYDIYTQNFIKEFGEAPNLSKEDFIELVRVNINRQVKELGILAGMMALVIGMGVIAPDDDEDRATKNAFRKIQKILDKFTSEILFFYNPGEMTDVLSGGIPAIGLFKDFGRAWSHFIKEITGMDVTNTDKTAEEVRKDAQPIKNIAKLVPMGGFMLDLLASVDAEFAKEYDITISKTAR